MTVGNLASSHWKKARKLTLLLFGTGFNSSKCKTMAKMAVARIKLLRNKRQVVVKQMRRDIAMLLESGQDATARIRVEHVIREQNILTANEFIELFCELIVARLPIIAKRKECPPDLKEGISSLIFSAPRCSDIPELTAIRDIFEKKYGKDFVSAATDLRPDCGVNRMLIDKLSVRTPSGEVKLKVLKEIAKEYLVEWDTKESEAELLKPPEELIEGPQTFVSASSLPIKPMSKQSVERNNPSTRYSDHGERSTMHFQDTASAAEAAAESAKQAIAAAGAAAYLANRDSYNVTANSMNTSSFSNDFDTLSGNTAPSMPNRSQINPMKQSYRRHSYNVPSARSDFNSDESDYDEEIEVEDPKGRVKVQPNNHAADVEDGKMCRRHSYNAPPANPDIKFDESDGEEEEPEMEERTSGTCFNQPPNRPAPNLPSARGTQNLGHRVHPKLPDYDEVTARFEALKLRKS